MYDIVIIGAGVSGCAIAQALSRYRARICVVEKTEDVCSGTSKANSGIVHAGFDAAKGSLMAKLNIEGSRMMETLAKELDFSFQRSGSLVICLDAQDRPALEKLYQNGCTNGVEGLRIIERDELLAMEPNVNPEAVAALYAPTGGIVCPFGITIAMAENASANGVEFRFNTSVAGLTPTETGWDVETDTGVISTKCVINAAGIYADVLHNMVSATELHITPRRGDYCLLDHAAADMVHHTLFQLPGKYGKGVLVSPTVHGNVIVGPTAIDIDDREGTNTTADGLAEVLEKAARTVPNFPRNQVITSFSGLRAHEDNSEFIIGEVADAPGFFDCAGIESPGLTSSPAIGRMMAGLLQEKLLLTPNPDFNGTRKGLLDPKTLDKKEYAALIQKEPAYGQIVCRCENVTEGEILDAIHRPLGATSLDGVKRRTRAGMGRCQAGFCSLRTMELLAEGLGIPQDQVTKSGGASKLILGIAKDQL